MRKRRQWKDGLLWVRRAEKEDWPEIDKLRLQAFAEKEDGRPKGDAALWICAADPEGTEIMVVTSIEGEIVATTGILLAHTRKDLCEQLHEELDVDLPVLITRRLAASGQRSGINKILRFETILAADSVCAASQMGRQSDETARRLGLTKLGYEVWPAKHAAEIDYDEGVTPTVSSLSQADYGRALRLLFHNYDERLRSYRWVGKRPFQNGNDNGNGNK